MYLEQTPDRFALEASALFFIPDAFVVLRSRHNMTATSLGALSTANRTVGGPKLAGKAAITKIIGLQPVAYASAKGFLPVANIALAKAGVARRFTTSDIVACVFRLPEFGDHLEDLGLTPASLAKTSKVSLPIVQSAMNKYRVSFAHAEALWKVLHSAHVAKGEPASEAEVTRHEFLKDIREFAKTDARPHLAVKTVQDNETVYKAEDLKLAAVDGHHWALSGSTED